MATIDIPEPLATALDEIAALQGTDVTDVALGALLATVRDCHRRLGETRQILTAAIHATATERIVAAIRTEAAVDAALTPDLEDDPCPNPEPTTPSVTTASSNAPTDPPPDRSSTGSPTTTTPEPSTGSPGPSTDTSPMTTTPPTTSPSPPDESSTPAPDGGEQLSCPMHGCDAIRPRGQGPDQSGLAGHLHAVHNMTRDGALLAVDRWTPDPVITLVDGRFLSELDAEADPDPDDDFEVRAMVALKAAIGRGWSHADIGEALGLHPTNVNLWLRNGRVFAPDPSRVEVLETLADVDPPADDVPSEPVEEPEAVPDDEDEDPDVLEPDPVECEAVGCTTPCDGPWCPTHQRVLHAIATDLRNAGTRPSAALVEARVALHTLDDAAGEYGVRL